jgi:hypothetical protein
MMSEICCSESECIDKILSDYNKNVFFKEDYYFWANQQYQRLTKLLHNPKNFQIVQKALNFVTYLNGLSQVDMRVKNEKSWDHLSEKEVDTIKIDLVKEFDPVGQEKRKIISELKELKCISRCVNL